MQRKTSAKKKRMVKTQISVISSVLRYVLRRRRRHSITHAYNKVAFEQRSGRNFPPLRSCFGPDMAILIYFTPCSIRSVTKVIRSITDVYLCFFRSCSFNFFLSGSLVAVVSAHQPMDLPRKRKTKPWN